MNSHLLPLFISYRSSGEKLIKYQANSSGVIMIMSIILVTTLFYKALVLHGEFIWCWSLLGLKGLTEQITKFLKTFPLPIPPAINCTHAVEFHAFQLTHTKEQLLHFGYKMVVYCIIGKLPVNYTSKLSKLNWGAG